MPDFAVMTAFKASDGVSSVFNRMGGAADRFGRRSSRAFSGATNMLRGFLPLLSVAGLIRFADQSIDAWRMQETAVANVEAGLKSTGGAIGITSQKLQGMASAWQDIGIFGDETILQSVTAQLLTFGSIGKKNFDEMQGAAMDITAKLYGVKASGEQLRDVTIMLGKAMDNPTRGMTALRRRGIQFTDAQERMVTVMQRVQGREAAQVYLLREIEKLYGGTNIALRKTSAGMELAAKIKLGDVMERTGKQLIPLQQAFFEIAILILPKVNAVLEIILPLLRALSPVILGIVAAYGLWKIATWGVIIAQHAMNIVSWIKYIWMMRTVIMTAIAHTKLWAIAQWLLNLSLWGCPIVWIIAGIIALGVAIVLLVKYWDDVSAAMSTAWEWIKRIGIDILGFFMPPINLVLDALVWLLELASNIPGIGAKLASAAAGVKDFQAAANATTANSMTSPNQSEVARAAGNDVGINIYNQRGIESSVKTTGKSAAPIKTFMTGENSYAF